MNNLVPGCCGPLRNSWEGEKRKRKKGLALSEKTNSFVTTWFALVGACCFDVAGLVWSPYWHVSAIVLLADVLFQDTGVDVGWLQRTGNIMTCGEGRVGNVKREDGEHLGISNRNLSADPHNATTAQSKCCNNSLTDLSHKCLCKNSVDFKV